MMTDPARDRPAAVGLLCMSLIDDEPAANALLRDIAERHGYDLVRVVGYWSRDVPGWWWTRLEDTVHRTGATAVVMISHRHASGWDVRCVAPATTRSASVRNGTGADSYGVGNHYIGDSYAPHHDHRRSAGGRWAHRGMRRLG